MCTSFCPKCGGDFLNDGPVCLACIKSNDNYMSRSTDERVATISRLCNLAADDDGERFIPATAEELAASVARIEGSGEATW